MNGHKFLKQLFETYVSNATIDNVIAQKKADNAYRWICSHLTTQELNTLQTAQIKALNNKKAQKEFFIECKKIRKRLFK